MVLLAAVFWQRRGRMRGEGVFLELEESSERKPRELAGENRRRYLFFSRCNKVEKKQV